LENTKNGELILQIFVINVSENKLTTNKIYNLSIIFVIIISEFGHFIFIILKRASITRKNFSESNVISCQVFREIRRVERDGEWAHIKKRIYLVRDELINTITTFTGCFLKNRNFWLIDRFVYFEKTPTIRLLITRWVRTIGFVVRTNTTKPLRFVYVNNRRKIHYSNEFRLKITTRTIFYY